MNISFVEKKANSAKIAVEVVKADYAEAEKAQLKKVTRNASLPGFRAGKVPAQLIKQKYGMSIHLDTVQTEISKALHDFVTSEKLRTIGQPFIPVGSEQENEFEKEDFTVTFSLALVPEITNLISTEDSLKKYVINVDAQESRNVLDRMLQDPVYATREEVDTVINDKAMVVGSVHELENGEPKENGFVSEHAFMIPEFMKNEAEKAKFVGAAKNSVVTFVPTVAYEGNDAEVASLLGVKKDEVAQYEGVEFAFEITRITATKAAELDQDFYDRVFGEDQVHNEEEAVAKIEEQYKISAESESKNKFYADLIDYIRATKLDAIELDNALIREWYTNFAKQIPAEEQDEAFEKSFAEMLDSLKLDLYIQQQAEKYEFTVSSEEVEEAARSYVMAQFASFGWVNPDPEIVQRQVSQLLQSEEQRYGIINDIRGRRVVDALIEKGDITIVEEEISLEEFRNLNKPAEEQQ